MGTGIADVSLEVLSNGDVLAEVNAAIKEVIKDVIARRHIPDDRKVTLTISVKPRVEENGANMPKFVSQVKSTVPGTRLKDSGMVRGDTVVVSTARQLELGDEEMPDNVEELPLQGKGGS